MLARQPQTSALDQLLLWLHPLQLPLLPLPRLHLQLLVPNLTAQLPTVIPLPAAVVLNTALSASLIATATTVCIHFRENERMFANTITVPGGTSYADTLNECIADCDNTSGCVDVSYIPGSPGPCYKKSSVAEIRQNDNVFGALQLTSCDSTIKLKLHRKRVVRAPVISKKIIQKRGVYGPDYTYTQGVTTITQTTTSTSVRSTTV